MSAAFSAANFPALAAGDSARLQVVVYDAVGNENNFVGELQGISISSSNPAVATARTETSDTTVASGAVLRRFYVWATGVSGGVADFSGTVTTPAGPLSVAAAPATVLAPVVTTAAPSGAPGATITIDGTGFVAAGFTTQVLVDGSPVGNITALSNTQITAQMPTLMAGTYDLEVSVGGVLSNADAWTQTSDYAEASSEPNDNQGQEAPITAGFEFTGTADEATDFSDLFEFTVSEDGLVIDLELSWGDGNDLDALIYPKGAQDPGDYATDACEFHLSTLANPESDSCTLGNAGVYTLEILHYGTGPTTYTVKGIIQP